MSVEMRDVSSRRSSRNKLPREAEYEISHAPDTANLTGGARRTTKSAKKQSFLTRIFCDTWTLEILCWLLALISVLIIIIVLATINGQPLRNWRSGLTLNTFINVVSQIAQTAVFVPVSAAISQMKWIWYSRSRPVREMEDFDKASRGPMDSLWLIAKHPKWILVYLAALNTSLTLLLGSFAQQSVSLPLGQTSLIANSSSVPIATQYDVYLSVNTLPLPDTGQPFMFDTVPPLVVSAVTNGLVTQATIDPSEVAAECTTGNCTFPDYTSLAVCSSIRDVTPSIQVKCPKGLRKVDLGCHYTVPPLQQWATPRRDNFMINEKWGPTLWLGASENDNSLPAENLVDFYILFAPDLSIYLSNSTANVTASIVALEVSISLCLKTYHTSVTNGVTTTGVVDSQLATFSEQTIIGGDYPTTKITANDSSGMEFYMMTETRGAFRSYLSVTTFYGTYSAKNPYLSGSIVQQTSDAAHSFGDIYYNNPPPDHITAIKPLLANLETSMSNVLRTTSNKVAAAPGTANFNETYVNVDFRWLIIPILSIVLSLVFLIAVAMETRSKKMPIWKDGVVKALCAIEPDTRLRMDGLEDSKTGLGSVPVVFDRDGGRDGWLRGPKEEWWADHTGPM